MPLLTRLSIHLIETLAKTYDHDALTSVMNDHVYKAEQFMAENEPRPDYHTVRQYKIQLFF